MKLDSSVDPSFDPSVLETPSLDLPTLQPSPRQPVSQQLTPTGLNIPERGKNGEKEASNIADIAPPPLKDTKWCRIDCHYFRLLTSLDVNSVRWPVQVGVSAAVCSGLFVFLPPSCKYFGTASSIGIVLIPPAVSATSGGSFQRAWSSSAVCTAAAILGYLCVLLASITTGFWLAAITCIIASLGAIPFAYCRAAYPKYIPALNNGMTTFEIILLAAYSASRDSTVISNSGVHAIKRAVSIVGAMIIVGLTVFVVFPRTARPAAGHKLSEIFSHMADILEPMADATRATSSAFLLASYPHLLASASSLRPPLPTHREDASYTTNVAGDNDAHHITMNFQTPEEARCAAMIHTVSKCVSAFASLSELVTAASHEFWVFRRPHRFSSTAFLSLVQETRTFFFHLSSLVFSLNLSFKTAAAVIQPLSQNDFFLPRKKKKHRSESKLQITSSTHKIINQRSLNIRKFLGSNSSFYRTSSNYLSASDLMTTKDLKNTNVLFSSIAQAMAEVLRCLNSILQKPLETEAQAKLELSLRRSLVFVNALEAIYLTHRKKFAVAVASAFKEKTTDSNKSPGIDWRAVIGTEAEHFAKLPRDEQKDYWTTFSLERDRIATSTITLSTMQKNLENCSKLMSSFLDKEARLSTEISFK